MSIPQFCWDTLQLNTPHKPGMDARHRERTQMMTRTSNHYQRLTDSYGVKTSFHVSGVSHILLLVICLSASFQAGCQFGGKLKMPKFAYHKEEPVFGPEPDLTQLVTHINSQHAGIEAWRSTKMHVKATGVPIPLKAKIATEKPNHLRLIVQGPTGANEVDCGSNEQGLWVWANQLEDKCVMTCNYEDVGMLQQQFHFPIKIEWIHKLIGLVPYNSASIELQRASSKPHLAYLVEHDIDGIGKPVRLMTLFDLNKGQVQSLQVYDAEETLVAYAELADYRKTSVGKVVPHRIELRLVTMRMGMTLIMDEIEINPVNLTAEIWEVPKIEGNPVRQISFPKGHQQQQHIRQISSEHTMPSQQPNCSQGQCPVNSGKAGSVNISNQQPNSSQQPESNLNLNADPHSKNTAPRPAFVSASEHQELDTWPPLRADNQPNVQPEDKPNQTPRSKEFEWAVEKQSQELPVKPGQTLKPATLATATEPPAGYSPAASSPSSAPHPQEQGLWRWLYR